jgi:hypothetical protein
MIAVLEAQVRVIRAAADLVERAGIADLAVMPGPDEIVIQVSSSFGAAAERAAAVEALAALAGCEAVREDRPGASRGRITARGLFAGCPVRVYTAGEEGPS